MLKDLDLESGLIRAGSCLVNVGFSSSYMYRVYILVS
jgi:hypothetical protein